MMSVVGASPVVRASRAAGPNAYGLATPKIFTDLSAAMRDDFLELVSCRGLLTKGPFDSFDAMVFPDREASQLLLEPALLMDVNVVNLAQRGTLGGLLALKNMNVHFGGTATISGKVVLNLKEPLTNTRMWSRTIDVQPESFDFTTENSYPTEMTEYQAKRAVLDDAGLLRVLLPKLEATYGLLFQAADRYMNINELRLVAGQATEVRKRGAISVPRE